MTDAKNVPQMPAEEADLQERLAGFNKELLPLLGKFELGLAAIAKILPDGRIAADPVVVSVRGARKEAAAGAEKPVAPKVEGGLDNPDA